MSTKLLEGISVLVVDDQEDARELLTLIFQTCGASVTAVGSSAEALDRVRQQLPDVVISDIGLPGGDGLGFMRALRALDRAAHVPAVALTAYTAPTDVAQALAAGFTKHVRKPVAPDDIVDVVADLARRK